MRECTFEHGSQVPMVKLVVEEVLEKLKLKQNLAIELVGLDDWIKGLTELVDVNDPDVQLIKIHGLGGIGKTTIAKVVFNKLSFHFGQCCGFLEDVRKSSSTQEGMVQLQKKLPSDNIGSRFAEKFKDSEQGIMRIGKTLCCKRVLLILDDDDNQLIGSGRIITTRDETILTIEGFTGKSGQYEILEMDNSFALQLFNRHAFDRYVPPNYYQELPNEFVLTTGQLPFTIVGTGSLLKEKDGALWEETLVRLRNEPHEDGSKTLEISYDGLDNNLRQIFLDRARFFINDKKTHAIYPYPSLMLRSREEVGWWGHLDPKSLVQLLYSYCSWRNLSALKFYHCEVEAIPLESLPTLERLIVVGCKQLEKLSIPLELRKLRQAWVSRCPDLVEIQVVGSRRSLESLRVYGCKALTRIGALSDLKKLDELILHQCNVLTTVEGLHELKSIKSMVVEKCRSLRWSIDGSCRNIPADFLVEAQGSGEIIKQGVKSFKRYREEILLDSPNKVRQLLRQYKVDERKCTDLKIDWSNLSLML